MQAWLLIKLQIAGTWFFCSMASDTNNQTQTIRMYNLSQALNLLDTIGPNNSYIGTESTDDKTDDYVHTDGETDSDFEHSFLQDEEAAEPSSSSSSVPTASSSSANANSKPDYVWNKSRFQLPDTTFRGTLLELPDS